MNTKIVSRAAASATIAFFASVKADLFRDLKRIVLLVTLGVFAIFAALVLMIGMMFAILISL